MLKIQETTVVATVSLSKHIRGHEEGIEVAKAEGKPMLIDFGMGCVNCRKMEEQFGLTLRLQRF